MKSIINAYEIIYFFFAFNLSLVLGLSSHFGSPFAVIDNPSKRIYQAYFCAGEPPETAQISDCP
jgi:hypothetical protein